MIDEQIQCAKWTCIDTIIDHATCVKDRYKMWGRMMSEGKRERSILEMLSASKKSIAHWNELIVSTIVERMWTLDHAKIRPKYSF